MLYERESLCVCLRGVGSFEFLVASSFLQILQSWAYIRSLALNTSRHQSRNLISRHDLWGQTIYGKDRFSIKIEIPLHRGISRDYCIYIYISVSKGCDGNWVKNLFDLSRKLNLLKTIFAFLAFGVSKVSPPPPFFSVYFFHYPVQE